MMNIVRKKDKSGRCVALLLLVLAIRVDESITLDDKCTVYKCLGNVNNSNVIENVNNSNVIEDNSSVNNYCNAADIPNDIYFCVIKNTYKGSFTDVVKVEFEFPEKECGFGLALLVNSSITNQTECEGYKFEGDINSKIHTIERTVCIVKSDINRLVRYNNLLKLPSCEDKVGVWFKYIFTGCYALQFHIGKEKYVKGNAVLNTNYQRTEVTEPHFVCNYDTYSNLDERVEMANFTLDTLLPIDTGLFYMTLIIPRDKIPGVDCVWYGPEEIIYESRINLQVDSKNSLVNDCTVKKKQAASGEYINVVQCNFEMSTVQTEDYCFVLQIIDVRCHSNSMWKPPKSSHPNMPCTWIKHCMKTVDSLPHNEDTIKSGEKDF